MKEKYKAILLVLASNDECIKNTRFIIPRMKPEWMPLYPYFKKIWESYMFTNSDIKVLFVYGGESNIQKQNYDLVYENVFENNYPGMITKTLYAMKDIDETYDYDFLIRTNLSTFWNLNKLSTRLDKLPREKCLAGTEIKLKDKQQNDYHYIAGYDMVISRDLVQGILPYTEEIINRRVYCDMEDLSLCTAFNMYCNVGVVKYDFNNYATNIGMVEFNEDQYKSAVANQFNNNLDHFRVKSRNDRNIDKEIHKRLLFDIYEKIIL